jgi:leucyl-tRNA synthetase
VEGGFRFLNRVWRLAFAWMPAIADVQPYDETAEGLEGDVKDLFKKTHATIHRVTRDIENRFHFNTAISAIMELVNLMQTLQLQGASAAQNRVVRLAMETVVLLLSPIVPHFADELWAAMGYAQPAICMPWPTYQEEALVKDELLIVVQVNGKVRSRFNVSADAGEEDLRRMALADERARHFVGDKTVTKVIVVKKKLVNIVV